MEHIKTPFFDSSPPTVVIGVTVLYHRNTLRAIICTCAVFWDLLYADIAENFRVYQVHALVLTI
jgi:hypothetical protein